MIEIRGLWAGYGGLDILRDVDLDVAEGSINCIVGPNGAGKSTVLKTISGLLAPRRGSVVIAGADLTRQTPAAILRAGVVQVPQRHGLFAGLTVRQNVLMGGYVIRRRRQAARAALRRAGSSSSPRSPSAPTCWAGRSRAASGAWWSSPAR